MVGGGIVGSCVAWRLAREGADVTLVDRGVAEGSASAASFAWVNASSVTGDRQYFEFRLSALAEWQRVIDQIGDGG